MGASDDPDPIEIEIVADGSPESPFARPEQIAVTGGTASAGGPERRVIVVAAAVAVMALALGWMLGRSASETTDGPSIAAASTAPSEPIEAVDTTVIEDIPALTTTAPGTTEATLAPETGDGATVDGVPVVAQVEVAPALVGQGIEIVTYGNGRQLQRLDLVGATLTTQRVERPPFGRPHLIVGDEWVMLPAADPAQATIVVDDDGTIDAGRYGPILQIAGTSDGSGPWVMSEGLAAGGAGTVARVPVVPGDVEETLFLPGPPSRFDPRGGFVVDAAGGSYRVDTDGVSQITTGELIAAGRDLALAEECDVVLACSVVVIDRATGARRPLDVDRPLDDSRLTSIAIVGNSSVAPGGSMAMVRVVNPTDQVSGLPTLGVVDLVTGSVTEVGPTQDIDGAVWSPDARFLFYNRGGTIVAYEPTTGDSHVVADVLIAVETFGVRVISDRS